MYRRILVLLDGSEVAEAALPHAAALARALGSHVELVQAVKAPTLVGTMNEIAMPPSYDSGSDRKAVDDYLRARAQELQEQGLEVSTVILDGSPKRMVVQYLKRNPPDLLVLSFRGRRGLSRWLHGSTAEMISRRSPCPVLVLKPGQEASP